MFKYTTRKDGRLMKKITFEGKTKYLYSDNVKDLEKQYIEYKYNLTNNKNIENTQISVESWSNSWLNTYKKNVARGTFKSYEILIRNHINSSIGSIKLSKLKQTDIINMLNEMNEKGITKGKNGALILVKSMLDKALENDLINKNVATGIKIPRHRSPEKTALDEETINKIKELSKTDNNAFMVLFLIYTGLRRGEVIPLKYSDLNLKEGYISVNKAVFIDTNQPIVKDTKNHENRIVPIFNILKDRLVEMASTHNENDYIFPNAKNEIMSQTSIRRKLESVNNKLDTNFTLHQLRHTFACILYKSGIETKQAQKWTGHKDIRVLLDIYTHLDSLDNKNSIDKVNAYIS